MKNQLLQMLALLMLACGTNRSPAQISERFNFTNLTSAVPDGDAAGLSQTHSITSAIVHISSVRVSLRIAGEFNGDLYGFVRHIGASRTNICVLLNRVGRNATDPAGYDDTGFNVTLDDTASGRDIHNYRSLISLPAGADLTESWQPDGRAIDPEQVADTSPRISMLTSFNNADANGEWTLFLADLESGGTNMLRGWALEFEGTARPAVTWPAPGDIVYGSPLSAAQLNASASHSGSFAYSPALGTILPAGSNHFLTVIFTPTDTASYTPVTNSVSVNVLRKALTIIAEDKTKLFGEALPVFTATYSGFADGEGPLALDTPVVFTTAAGMGSNAGLYPIHPFAAAANYAIAFLDGHLSILPGGTGGLLSSSVYPSLPGQQVIFTLQLSAISPGAGTPTGTVLFRIDGVGVSVPLIGGITSYSTATLALGFHTVTTEYYGSSNFLAVTNSLSRGQLVNTPPAGGPDAITRSPRDGVRVSMAALLSNDSDADGDPLTFVSFTTNSANDGAVFRQDDWIYYQPSPGFTNIDTFTYFISDGRGTPVSVSVTIFILEDPGLSPNLTITDLGNGSFWLRFDGISSKTYRIEFNENMQAPAWQTLATATTNRYGSFEYIDQPPVGARQRFYRTTCQ